MSGENDEIAHAILRDFENPFQWIAATNMVAYLVQPLYMVAAKLFQQDFRMLLSRPLEFRASLWLALVRFEESGFDLGQRRHVELVPGILDHVPYITRGIAGCHHIH